MSCVLLLLLALTAPNAPGALHLIWGGPPAETPVSVLFVVTDPAAMDASSETPLQTSLEGLGYTVTLIDDDTAAPSPVTQDVVIISRSAPNTGTKYNTVTNGVLVMRHLLFSDYRLHASNGDSSTANSIYNLATGHYVVQDFSASASISYAAFVGRSRFVNSTVPAGVVIVAQSTSSATQPVLVIAPAGATLTSGTAQGRRAAWGHFQWAESGANAVTLLQRIVEWLSGLGAD